MKRIASILTGLSLAVLFLAGLAAAQSDGQRLTANIPFEFTVGSTSLPAGQYEFTRTGGNIFLVRDADRHSLFTVSSASIDTNGLSEKSTLKFATIDGRHVLVQIWNESAAIGNEFSYGHAYVDLAKRSTN